MPSQSGIRVERIPGSPRAILWLEREPVNSMTLEFWRALSNAFDALERDETVCATAESALMRELLTTFRERRCRG